MFEFVLRICMSLTGAQLANFERGRWLICKRKDEIIHGNSKSKIK